MAMNLGIKRETLTPSENQEWLGSAHGTQEMDSITLDAALCRTAFPTGVIPSGIKLGKVTATGLYAPSLEGAVNGTETVAGHLFTTVDLTAGGAIAVADTVDTPASLLWHGEVVTAKIPALAVGAVRTAGAALIKYV